MRPRTVAVWSLCAVGTVVLTNNPAYRGLVALVALNFLLARRRPGTSLRGLLTLLGAFAAVTIVYNPLISHTGVHHLIEIPVAIPGIGGPVTMESLAYGVSAAVGLVAAALAVAPLVIILAPTDLLEALPPGLHGTGTALASALNLVPAVARSFVRVREAELLRGGTGRRGPLALLGTVVPVALTTIESSITLAEAMEARAYGSGPRTRRDSAKAGPRDWIVVAAAVVATAALLTLRFLGTNLDWYPFPSLTLPDVNGLAVAAIVMLSAPLVVGAPRRSARVASSEVPRADSAAIGAGLVDVP